MYPTGAPTNLESCNPDDPPCLTRFLGICWKFAECERSIFPTSVPTPKPSTPTDCDPNNPPCKTKSGSFCTEYHDCSLDGNHKHRPKKEFITSFPTYQPTAFANCDPRNPPCEIEGRLFGICWKYAICPEEKSEGEGEGEEGEEEEKNEEKSEEGEGEEEKNEDEEKSEGKGEDEEDKEDENEEKSEGEDEEEKGKNQGEGEEESESPTSGETTAEEASPSPEPTQRKPEPVSSITVPGSPTFEPTTRRECDPNNPPCKTWLLGICFQRVVCYGKDAEPANSSFSDDQIGTAEPTHMPVPVPSPMPTQYPSSTPSTSGPTLTGYTPSPTVSMRPTPAETHGPTSFTLCDPNAPPCDSYFFGACMGPRRCYGSVQPTPHPTAKPTTSTDFPTSSPTTSWPTPDPTVATSFPTSNGETYFPTTEATTLTPTATIVLVIPEVPTFAPTMGSTPEVTMAAESPQEPSVSQIFGADSRPIKLVVESLSKDSRVEALKQETAALLEEKMKDLKAKHQTSVKPTDVAGQQRGDRDEVVKSMINDKMQEIQWKRSIQNNFEGEGKESK
jgi:hypothetical protein